MRQPKTRGEWQQAVDLAEVMLLVDSARLYGLVAGGPPVNVERCREILAAGARRGYRPRKEAVGEVIPELMGLPGDRAKKGGK